MSSLLPYLLGVSAMAAVMAYFWRRARLEAAELRRSLARAKGENQLLQELQAKTLRDSLAQRAALFNSMGEGVLILDSYGHIQLVNRSLERLFELKEDIRGRTVLEAFRLSSLQELAQQTGLGKQMLESDLDLPGLQGRCLRVNAANILNGEGQSQGVILVFHDLTRLRQLENTRRDFVANVSHELRTPLSMIKGYVETLLDGAKDDPAVAGKFLHIIDKHADRLTFLIEDLLTLSQLESGQVALNLQDVSLHRVAQRVVEDLSSRAAASGIGVLNEIPKDLMARVDADRLQQVFSNLLDNAIKYGHRDGEVVLACRTSEESSIEVSVRDDGPGIPVESLGRVFERFYRVDKARSREQGGTGLGLAIVKHIVQLHGGEVGVQSEPGKGTTFRFRLPGARSNGAAVPK
jgi:two-component system phosphate regulon sensor histidine kinase PhoR